MKTDDFEKQLQQQPLRQIPGDWREAILRRAQEQASYAAQSPEPFIVRALITIWRELLEPCRYAWLGIAALWMIFWMINAQTQLENGGKRMAGASGAGSEPTRLFEEQRRVLVELTGPPLDSSQAGQARAIQPKPRSERVLERRNC